MCWCCIFCHRGHFLQCKRGFLGKHFEKIIQFDPHLNFLSQQSEILLESPYFEQSFPPFGELNESSKVFDLKVEKRPALFALGQAASPYRFHSSSMNDENQVFNVSTSESTSQENPSPITGKIWPWNWKRGWKWWTIFNCEGSFVTFFFYDQH